MQTSPAGDGKILAVLGPTNTGKTHLAVERMAAHSSGMIGFPLRLLAREIYDRVVAMKGAGQVALLTGEERIMPPDARYILCTAEAMPVDRSMAFVAIDEVQLGADAERGHVFTDRLLRARGREETMILGSASATGLVRHLVPEAEIVTRPRFSTLSYGGARKLSRLPRRSAIVAFSAEQVYAIAETLRRFAGGAAVVMGALSPRTRNAQVAMFQAGEVDYLVATDAIGMGLNLDVAHVAFAGFSKFDGRRQRRLTIAEMAQIAGRAGRHQQDGTFGSVGGEAEGFTPEEVQAIEEHRMPALGTLFWRDGSPDTATLAGLIASLEAVPADPMLRAAPEAVDLAVLRRLADDPAVAAACTSPELVRRLWDVCGLPDFQKTGADHHARTVQRLWQYRSTGDGHVDPAWFAGQLDKLDRTEGDVETLAARIAQVRTWCYIANRGDWLAGSPGWAERARGIEGKLSDALHDALTQRFVNRRTTVLLRDLKQARASLPVDVAEDGAVRVDGELIGTLDGFTFRVDPRARAADHRILLAAAERHLAREWETRAMALAGAAVTELTLESGGGATGEGPGEGAPTLRWRGTAVATLARGRQLMDPQLTLDPALRRLEGAQADAIRARLLAWLEGQLTRHLAPLRAMTAAAGDAATPAPVRALLAALVERGGIAPRAEIADLIDAVPREERVRLRRLGLVPGTLDLFHPLLLKPQAVAWRAALMALARGVALPPLPPVSAVVIPAPAPGSARWGAEIAGFRPAGSRWLRIDLAERLAREAHAARQPAPAPAVPDAEPDAATQVADDAHPAQTDADTPVTEALPDQAAPSPTGEGPAIVPATEPEPDTMVGADAGEGGEPSSAEAAEAPSQAAPATAVEPRGHVIDPAFATSLGLDAADRAAFLATLGFRPLPVEEGAPALWRWISPQRQAAREARARARAAAVARQRRERSAQPVDAASAPATGSAEAPRAVRLRGPRPKGGARREGEQEAPYDRPPRDRPPRTHGAPRPEQRPATASGADSPFAALAALLPGLVPGASGSGKGGGGGTGAPRRARGPRR